MPNFGEDIITNVQTLDIQLLDSNRADATTIKLDNPVQNVTREMVSAAMQLALANELLLTNKGSVAKYLGDITVNQSIKRKLDGQDFYVTPTELALTVTPLSGVGDNSASVTVSGATIQGYNFKNFSRAFSQSALYGKISDNGLTFTITAQPQTLVVSPITMDLELIIMGLSVIVPVTFTQGA